MSSFINSIAGLHRDSKISLITWINQTNNVNLDPEMVLFSPPFPTENTFRAETTDRNTIIRITARKEYDQYRGSAILLYNRLDIAKLNQLIDVTLETNDPQTTHDLLIPLWRRYGIILTEEDILDEPLVNISETPEAENRVLLKAHPSSLKWIGEFEVVLLEGRVEFRDFLTEVVLPGMNYPVEGDGSTGSAVVYAYSLNFTPAKEVLATYPVGFVIDEFDDGILNAFKAVDIYDGKDLWNVDPENPEWSLHGAEVFYNGINDESLPTNNSFKYVMGLRLRETVTTPPGAMYLHYNEPFDPMILDQSGSWESMV